MIINNLIFDPDTFGITVKSLQMLRNTLAERINHKLSIAEVNTSDICCAFFIFDLDTYEVIFSGDGFRSDRCGEGGSGYKSAKALLSIYGLRTFTTDRFINFEALYQKPTELFIRDSLLKQAQKIADAGYLPWKTPASRSPEYVR